MSTGAATLSDIDLAVSTLRENGCKDLTLLKCTSTYPASPENTNLLTIPHLKNLFDCNVGLSDHTMGIGVSVASVALGATVIEKHFTLNRSEGGVDSAFSIEPEELKNLVIESRRAFLALGNISYGVTNAERKSLIYKRSIYISEPIKKGDILTTSNTRIVRPGDGLPSKFYPIILGKKINTVVKAGTPMSWDLI
jgi:N-acetylneuraminate synthase